MPSIGQRVRALRKTRTPALTQVELSKLAGIDQSTISDIERGAKFSAEILMALSDALNVSPAYIMRGGSEQAFQEDQLIAHFRACTPDDRDRLLSAAEALAARSPANPFPPSAKAK